MVRTYSRHDFYETVCLDCQWQNYSRTYFGTQKCNYFIICCCGVFFANFNHYIRIFSQKLSCIENLRKYLKKIFKTEQFFPKKINFSATTTTSVIQCYKCSSICAETLQKVPLLRAVQTPQFPSMGHEPRILK